MDRFLLTGSDKDGHFGCPREMMRSNTGRDLSVSDDTLAICQSIGTLCNILIDLRSDIAVMKDSVEDIQRQGCG